MSAMTDLVTTIRPAAAVLDSTIRHERRITLYFGWSAAHTYGLAAALGAEKTGSRSASTFPLPTQ